jgi:hypothetical protein
MVEEYDVEASEPDSYSQDELDEIRREMRRKITEAFAPGWYDDNENGEDEN